ncbi:IS66 family insertion sequence element accessory protein TnpB [Verrucomicrobium spinosum]
MRKDRLYANLQDDPRSGSLFVFSNRRHSVLKILYWDGSGWWQRQCAKTEMCKDRLYANPEEKITIQIIIGGMPPISAPFHTPRRNYPQHSRQQSALFLDTNPQTPQGHNTPWPPIAVNASHPSLRHP